MGEVFDAELLVAFKTVSVISIFIPAFSLATKFLLVAQEGFSVFANPLFHFSMPALLLGIGLFLHWSPPKQTRYLQIIILVWAEAVEWGLRTLSIEYFEHRSLYASAAMGVMITFQARILNSLHWVILFSVKHSMQWYIADIIKNRLKTKVVAFHEVTLLVMLLLPVIGFLSRQQYSAKLQANTGRLQQSEKNVTNLVNTLSTGVTLLNQDFSLVQVNQRVLQLFDCEEETLSELLSFLEIDKNGGRLLSKLQAALPTELNASVLLGSVEWNTVYISVSFSRIHWNNSWVFVLLFTDITQSVLLERTQAEDILKSKFLKCIPHELNTQTVGILGSIDTALSLLSDHSVIKAAIEVVHQSARLLYYLIQNITDYTLILSGVFRLTKSDVHLQNCFDEVRAVFVSQLHRRKLNFVTRIDPALPEIIRTDGSRLQQILVALVSNSIKHSQQGSIEIVATAVQSDFATIEVTDMGIGIPPERLAFILNQLAQPTTGEFLFSLEVANQIAIRLGGSGLKITSDVGTSVKFQITLTSVTDARFNEVEECDDTSAFADILHEGTHCLDLPLFQFSPNTCPVLIVDDTEHNRTVLASLLERHSLPYIECQDGLKAVDLVAHHARCGTPIKVVIMDIEMPVMNGWEATIQILKLFEEGLLPVRPSIIGYSAYSAPEYIEQSYAVGMVTYLVKPCKADDLVRTIKILLNS